MEKLGATKKTSNIQFNNAMQGYETMRKDVIELDQALRGYIAALKGRKCTELITV